MNNDNKSNYNKVKTVVLSLGSCIQINTEGVCAVYVGSFWL